MRGLIVAALLLLPLAAVPAGPARACGFGEAPGDCGQTPESEARALLARVVRAIQHDKAKALEEFSKGENGFRTVDQYVFCVGPDGVMSAHPNPKLQGTDVRDLHDSTGNRFIAKMLDAAKAGKIASIRYLFPRPGSTREQPKLTFYTRADDQVCGVGVYDDADTAKPQTAQERLAALRQRLAMAMPPNLRTDWTAYNEALDEDRAAKSAAFERVREQVHAAEALLGRGSDAPR